MLTLEMAIQKIYQLPSEQQNQLIKFIEFLEFQSMEISHTSKVFENSQISFTQATQEFIGCLDSDLEDLSCNPKYLEGFGEY